MLTTAQLYWYHVLHSRNTLLYFPFFLAKTWDGNVVAGKSACPLFLGSCEQTSAYVTPYKVVLEKENDEKHSTINLDWHREA